MEQSINIAICTSLCFEVNNSDIVFIFTIHHTVPLATFKLKKWLHTAHYPAGLLYFGSCTENAHAKQKTIDSLRVESKGTQIVMETPLKDEHKSVSRSPPKWSTLFAKSWSNATDKPLNMLIEHDDSHKSPTPKHDEKYRLSFQIVEWAWWQKHNSFHPQPIKGSTLTKSPFPDRISFASLFKTKHK